MRLLFYVFLFSIIPIGLHAQADSCALRTGTNLSAPVDWGSEWPFVNIMKHSRRWITSNVSWVPGGKNLFDTGLRDSIPMDSLGYPMEIPVTVNHPNADTAQRVEAIWAHTEALPEGMYTLLYDGTGTIDFWGDARIVSSEPGRMEVRVSHHDNIMILRILRSEKGDHIRNIRFLLPGTEETYQEDPFTASWLKKLDPFNALRFMNWGFTNDSDIREWSERTMMGEVTYFTGTDGGTGIPYEWWIRLCNRQRADAWINIPHRADSNFIANMARLFRDSLDPGLKIYVEYTNEYWNWIFDQAHYVNDSLSQDLPWPRRYAPRLGTVMRIWSEVFAGEEDRLVRVFATQHAWPWLGWQVLDQMKMEGTLQYIDAVSVAGYMSTDTDRLSELGAEARAEDVIEFARQLSFDPNEWLMDGWYEHASMADSFDLELHFYEGGQHFTPEPFGQPQPYCPALNASQAHPEMYELYARLFDTLETLHTQPMQFMHFNFIADTSCRYGSWGALTHQWEQQSPYMNIAPKYQALLDQIAHCQLTSTRPEFINDRTPRWLLYPNPNRGTFYLEKQQNNHYRWLLDIISVDGVIQFRRSIDGYEHSIELKSHLKPGYYLLRFRRSDGMVNTKQFIIVH